MKSQKFYQILSVMLLCMIVLTAVCIIGGGALAIIKIANPSPSTETDTAGGSDSTQDQATAGKPQEVVLGETADAGMEYIDKMIFFGESTTAHLRARGVLSGGSDTLQVWADSSGTRTLSSKITSEPIIYPATGESMTVAEACALARPEYLVLSFGLNGISGFISNKDSYVNNYNKLIAAVQQASPNTKIILQSVYPIAETNDDFSVDALTIDRYILTLNGWLQEIASSNENVRYADTASVLRNDLNALNPVYDSGDGIHLTKSAYEKILYYLRTHAWQ